MITINLLPEEYRRACRTSLKLFVSIAAAVAVNASLLALWSWKEVGTLAEVDNHLAVLESDANTIRPRVEHHRSLDRESKQFQAREETLARITHERVSWTEKLDQFIDVLNRGGDAEKYLVWLDDLKVTQSANPRGTGSGGTLVAQAHSGSNHFALVAEFLEDLEESDFARDFAPPAPPEATLSARDETLEPSEIFNFKLALELLDSAQRTR